MISAILKLLCAVGINNVLLQVQCKLLTIPYIVKINFVKYLYLNGIVCIAPFQCFPCGDPLAQFMACSVHHIR